MSRFLAQAVILVLIFAITAWQLGAREALGWTVLIGTALIIFVRTRHGG